MLKKFWRGVKNKVEEKVNVAKEVLASDSAKFILGSMFVALGGSMIASIWIPRLNGV